MAHRFGRFRADLRKPQFFAAGGCIRALLTDPANNAPLPIVNWDLKKMLEELAPPKAP